jgi:hypothetical protein
VNLVWIAEWFDCHETGESLSCEIIFHTKDTVLVFRQRDQLFRSRFRENWPEILLIDLGCCAVYGRRQFFDDRGDIEGSKREWVATRYSAEMLAFVERPESLRSSENFEIRSRTGTQRLNGVGGRDSPLLFSGFSITIKQ